MNKRVIRELENEMAEIVGEPMEYIGQDSESYRFKAKNEKILENGYVEIRLFEVYKKNTRLH
jgi:hypothetical protein